MAFVWMFLSLMGGRQRYILRLHTLSPGLLIASWKQCFYFVSGFWLCVQNCL
jgi:hypothetical protein